MYLYTQTLFSRKYVVGGRGLRILVWVKFLLRWMVRGWCFGWAGEVSISQLGLLSECWQRRFFLC